MEQYYNFVTKAGGTLTLEEVQRICSVNGQSVQLVVEGISNGGNGSQQFLAYTAAPQASEQAIFSQQTINLGNQISTTQLEQGQNVFIIKTSEIAASSNTLTSNKTDVRPAGESIVSVRDKRGPNKGFVLAACKDENGQQAQWVKMQDNSFNTVDTVTRQQGTLLTNKEQNTGSARSPTQNSSPLPSGIHGHPESQGPYDSTISDRKPLRLYQGKNRNLASSNSVQSSGSTLAVLAPAATRDAPSLSVPGEKRTVRNATVTTNVLPTAVVRPSLAVNRNKLIGTPRHNVTATVTRPTHASHSNASSQSAPPSMSKNLSRLQTPGMPRSNEHIKQDKVKQLQSQRQQVQDDHQQNNVAAQRQAVPPAWVRQPHQSQSHQQQHQQVASTASPIQGTRKQVTAAAESKPQNSQQRQRQQQQQQLSIPAPPAHNMHENMDIDSDCTSQERGQSNQQCSDSENSASESFAYLLKIIDNPLSTSVQHHVLGNTAKMLIKLSDVEQKLITFNIPSEDCTVQDLLEQANITFCGDIVVSLVSDSTLGINYIVEAGPSTASAAHDGHDNNDINSAQDGANAQFDHFSHGISSPDENSNPVGHQNETFYKKSNERNTTGKLEGRGGGTACKRNRGRGRGGATPRSRPINREPECLTISSDEEEEAKVRKTSGLNSCSALTDASNSINEETEMILEKEPVITNNSVSSTGSNYNADMEEGGARENEAHNFIDSSAATSHTALLCRTVRIGSYKYVPRERVVISQNGVRFRVPLLEDDKNFVTLDVKFQDIVKVLIHFGKTMPVLFFYTSASTGAMIRELLGMQDPKGPYYDPAGKDHTHKRITLLPEKLTEESKVVLKSLLGARNLLAELNPKEANDILIRASPKDSLQIQGLGRKQSQTASTSNANVNGGIQTLTVYPPPPAKGGIAINTEDYLCLGEDQFLNDVIIDFYLKYLTLEVLSESDQQRTHVFSSYFYKRLTSPHAQATESTEPLSAAAKRHARVQKWTKNVNIFEKDFIVIPINEHAHWFLAIICFPGLVGNVFATPSTPLSIKEEDIHKTIQKSKKLKELKLQTVTIGSTTITPMTATITIDQPDDGSERDEAEGDDDEMEVDSDEDDGADAQVDNKNSQSKTVQNTTEQEDTIRVPCILIFDSLAGASRARVVATLRDYLSCEHVAKLGVEKTFSKDTIKGASPRVPQQSNFTDCGLYVLQYVESFFKCPIKDYTLPIRTLKAWFEEIVVTRKREELSKLLIRLMNTTRGDKSISLPAVNFPTQDGRLKPKSENASGETKQVKSEADNKKKVTALDSETTAPRSVNSNMGAVATDNSGAGGDDDGGGGGGDSGNIESVNRTTYQIIPFSSTSASSITTDSVATEILPEQKSHTRSSSETMSYLKSKRIPRLMSRTENQEDPQAAKKHKGESFNSCK